MEDCNRLADIIRHYFSNGLAYIEIIELIGIHHGCFTSLSTLKRWLRQENFVRRPLAGRRSPQRDTVNVIAEELGGGGSNIGYRKMHRYFQAKGMIFPREDVRATVKELDAEGVH